jgi:phosphoglucosamine mutase
MLLAALVRADETLQQASRLVVKYPQRLVSVRADRGRLKGATAIWDAVRAAEEELAGEGRIVLRASGTEPLVRVMVEAETQEICDRYCHDIVGLVRSELALDGDAAP